MKKNRKGVLMMHNKITKNKLGLLVKQILCISMSATIVFSGVLGANTVQAGEAEHNANMECLNELTSDYLKSFTYTPTGEKLNYSLFLKGDFDIPPFAANDDGQIMNKKILTTKTDNLLTFDSFFNWDKDNPYGNDIDTLIGYPKNGSTIKDTWAEMLCLAMRDENKTTKGGFMGMETFPAISGAYCTDVYYGSNPVKAFESAVKNDRYLSDKDITDPAQQIGNSNSLNQAYARAAVMWGGDQCIYQDIATKYKVTDTEPQFPCYCMIVVNNVNSLDEKIDAELNTWGGLKDYFGKGKPYIYVLFFHDFNAVDRQEDYFTTSAQAEVTDEDTIDTLKEKGIECNAKDVRSNVTYENKDIGTGADLYSAENLTGSTSSVTTAYTVEEGISKSVTQECSYSKAFTDEVSATLSMSYNVEASSGLVKVGMNMGFSATEMASWTVESSRMEGTTTDNSKVVTRSKEYTLDMPAYTKSTLTVQPTETTITYKYDSKVSPVYQTDMLLYDPYFDTPINSIYRICDDNQTKIILAFQALEESGAMYANCINPDSYKNITIDNLFNKTVVNYAHNKTEPSPEDNWMKHLVENRDSQASLLLGNLKFCQPTLPCGGEFSMTKKGVRITASQLEPARPLKIIKPSLTRIDMYEDDVYDMEMLNVEGINDMGAPFYGFEKNISGEWAVESGPAVLKKNKAGNLELKATGLGTAILRYIPSHISSDKLSQTLDNRGITIDIKSRPTVSTIKPSAEQIELNGDKTYDMDQIKLTAQDEQGNECMDFDQSKDGEWVVESGPAVIEKDSDGKIVLKATGNGTVVLRYRLLDEEDNGLPQTQMGTVTVTIKDFAAGSNENSENESGKSESGGDENDENGNGNSGKVTSPANDTQKGQNQIQQKTTVTAPAKVVLSSAKNNKAKTCTVKWKAVSGAKGYEVQYAYNKKFTKNVKTKTVTKKSLKIKKLKKGETCYVRVRAYKTDASGEKIYGSYSKVKKVKIKK